MEAQDLWALFPLTPLGLLLWLDKGSAIQTQPPSRMWGVVPCSGGTEARVLPARVLPQQSKGGFALGEGPGDLRPTPARSPRRHGDNPAPRGAQCRLRELAR